MSSPATAAGVNWGQPRADFGAHFPVQPWERELEQMVKRASDQSGHHHYMSAEQEAAWMIDQMEPEYPPEQKEALKMAIAARLTGRSYLEDEFDRIATQFAGGAIALFFVARLGDDELVDLVQVSASYMDRGKHGMTTVQRATAVRNLAIAEQTRREKRAAMPAAQALPVPSSSSLLQPRPGGLPHFPLQPWERAINKSFDADLHIWNDDEGDSNDDEEFDVGTFSQHGLVHLYRSRAAERYPASSRLSVREMSAGAHMWSFNTMLHHNRDHTVELIAKLCSFVRKKNGPGTPLWHYAVERLSDQSLELLMDATDADNRYTDIEWSREERDQRRVEWDAVHAGAVAEFKRRNIARRDGHARASFAQSNVLDWMTSDDPATGQPRLNEDTAQLVGQFHSGRITPRYIPGIAHSGPVRSARALVDLAARATQAAAAAAANPASAVAALERTASELADLSAAVAKRSRHE